MPEGMIYNINPADAAHWDRVRAQLRAGSVPAERHPMPTLKQQAARQIAILERDLAEWREIERRG